ncbi:MAG: malonyl-CoA decarboxylase [Rhodobacteraceae bacterium]|nr:malonyl-CoA decarboxylase [Paracoccaceae bacterium]
MSFLADLLSTLLERGHSGAQGKLSSASLRELCEALLGTSGEVSGSVLARQVLDRYRSQDESGRWSFFRHLADELDVDPDAIAAAAAAVREDNSLKAYRGLMAVTEPRRQELIRRLNQVPGATEQLVAMRTDLLRFIKDTPDLGRIDYDFRHLFASWFNRGFLVLRPISWQSPANILEKIIAYEAVHAITSWDDLRRRLEPQDRRCFAFFHPAMPEEPLIFVEVALTKGVPGSVQKVLAEEREEMSPDQADTAVFYSISNCQPGLAGISFGNSLIKQVVADLSRELPQLRTFVTLSPIPGFTKWMRAQGMGEALMASATEDEYETLAKRSDEVRALAAHYLINAKRDNGSPYDPVARFHLTNGALVHDVHALADISPNGLKQSCGAMVNYLYDIAKVEANHEAMATDNRVIASRGVEALAKAAQLPQPKKKEH